MDVKIAPDWKELLAPEFEKPYFVALTDFVRQEYATRRIYPRGSNIFRAFDKCPFDRLKVVIIGQDPYHGPGQANGLCFSVADGIPLPAVAAKYLQGGLRRHRNACPRLGQPRPLGRAGRAAAELRADGPRPRGGLARRPRLGDLHRRRGPRHRRTQGGHRLYALGQLRPAQGRHRRPAAQPHPSRPCTLAALGLPRILRLPPLPRANDYLRSAGKEPIVW